MKTTVFALLAFTTLASPALAQSAPAPMPDQSQAAPAVPATPPAQMSPQPQQGAMMCGMMAAGQQQGQGQQGGCGCCRGMMGNQSQRQGAMPMDHSRMTQMHHGQGPSMASGSSAPDHAGHGAMNATQTPDMPATKALRDASARMHRAMDIRYANDIDVDFARSNDPAPSGRARDGQGGAGAREGA